MNKNLLCCYFLFCFSAALTAQIFEQNPEKVYVYQLINGNKVFYRWHLYSYNSNGMVLSHINSVKGGKDTLNKFIYLYDKDENITHNTHWEYFNNTWQLASGFRRLIVAYDSIYIDKPSVEVTESYESNNWVGKNQKKHSYNTNGKLQTIRFFDILSNQSLFENRQDSLVYDSVSGEFIEWFVKSYTSQGLKFSYKYINLKGKYTGNPFSLSHYEEYSFTNNSWKKTKKYSIETLDSLGSNQETVLVVENDTLKPQFRFTKYFHPKSLTTEYFVEETGIGSSFVFSTGNFYSQTHENGRIKSVLVHNLKTPTEPLAPYEEYIYNPTFSVNLSEIYLENQIQVYPNPFNDKIYLSGNKIENSILKVKNTKGDLVFKLKLDGCELDLSMLEAGLYFLILENNEHWFKPLKILKY